MQFTHVATIYLLDGYPPGGRTRRLRHRDVQYAIPQTGLDLILIDARREAEGTIELADGALSDPVPPVGGLALLAFADGELTLGLALDDERVRVRELDVDVLLINTRQLAFQDILVLGLADVEARGERAHRQPRVAVCDVVVVVVQQPEQRGELSGREARDERHASGGCWRRALAGVRLVEIPRVEDLFGYPGSLGSQKGLGRSRRSRDCSGNHVNAREEISN